MCNKPRRLLESFKKKLKIYSPITPKNVDCLSKWKLMLSIWKSVINTCVYKCVSVISLNEILSEILIQFVSNIYFPSFIKQNDFFLVWIKDLFLMCLLVSRYFRPQVLHAEYTFSTSLHVVFFYNFKLFLGDTQSHKPVSFKHTEVKCNFLPTGPSALTSGQTLLHLLGWTGSAPKPLGSLDEGD